MADVVDLDILRPAPRVIVLAGKKIDVSFIPCGLTFDIDGIVQEIAKLDEEEIGKGGEVSRQAFDLSVRLCAKFCSWKYPEMDEEWFRQNTDAIQVNAFATEVKDTLFRSYEGVEAYQKN